jgi:hypothetical protein
MKTQSKKITLFNAVDIILDIDNEFFTVEFIKKDNTLRKMNCRKGVKKHLKNGSLPYDPFKKGLLPVFDLHKQGYRMINIKSLVSLSFKGTKYNIE